jgi:multicomponent Na+:H+ antiporter subunit D
MIFGFIMGLMAIIGTIYGLHVKDNWQHMAAWFYVAGSLGVIYAEITWCSFSFGR